MSPNYLHDRESITPQPMTGQATMAHGVAEDPAAYNSADEPASADIGKFVEDDSNSSPLKPPPPSSDNAKKPVRKPIEVSKAVQEVEERSDSSSGQLVESVQVVKKVKGAAASRSVSKPRSKAEPATETTSRLSEDSFSTLI